MSSSLALSFARATASRRSRRALQNASTIADSDIVHLAQEALRVVPSAFNSQTTRLTVLLSTDHKRLWSITGDTLRANIGEERYNAQSRAKIDAFASSYGTILFWDDQETVDALRIDCPELYKGRVDEWVHQSNGMHQYYIWVALEAHGLGANVQHFNPFIDEEVKKTWNMPSQWALRAQMVFGTPKEGSQPRDRVQKTPVTERMAVFGAQQTGHGQL